MMNLNIKKSFSFEKLYNLREKFNQKLLTKKSISDFNLSMIENKNQYIGSALRYYESYPKNLINNLIDWFKVN